MRNTAILAPILLLFLLSACSDERTRQLNRVSRKVIVAAKDSKTTAAEGLESLKNMEMPEIPSSEDISGASDEFIDKLSTATAEKVADNMREQMESKTKSAQESYTGVTKSIRDTKNSAKSKIRWVVRRTPASQREANQLAESYGKGSIEEFQAWLDAAAKRGAFRVDKRADKRRVEK